MDKSFVKELKLEEAIKRFNQLNEYTFITSPLLSEDDEQDDEQQPMNNNGQEANPPMPQNGQNDVQAPMDNMSQDNNMGQQSMNNEPMPQTSPMDNQGDDVPMDNEEPSDMIEPMSDEVDDTDVETQQEGDEVIDIDDLTRSQETSEIKIDGVDDKLTRMLSILDKFTNALEANDKKIDDLRKEVEERNPSDREKLNIRSQASYPYSEQPKDYWDKKMANNPHYDVIYDNEVAPSDELKKFEITKDDIDNIDYNDINRSFDLQDYLKF